MNNIKTHENMEHINFKTNSLGDIGTVTHVRGRQESDL